MLIFFSYIAAFAAGAVTLAWLCYRADKQVLPEVEIDPSDWAERADWNPGNVAYHIAEVTPRRRTLLRKVLS